MRSTLRLQNHSLSSSESVGAKGLNHGLEREEKTTVVNERSHLVEIAYERRRKVGILPNRPLDLPNRLAMKMTNPLSERTL